MAAGVERVLDDSSDSRRKKVRKNAKKDSEIIADIQSISDTDSLFRSSLEQAWFINHMNYLGFQWDLIDPVTGAFDEIPNEVKFKANKIQAHINHRVAKTTSMPPDWDVDSDCDSRDIQAAKYVCEKVLEWVWDKERCQQKCKELVTLASIRGTSFIGPVWDRFGGKALDPDDLFPGEFRSEEDLPAILEIFEGDFERAEAFLAGDEIIRDGDIKIRLLDAFDVFVDPAGEDEESLDWVLIRQLSSVDDIEEKYGKAVDPEPIGDSSGPSYKYRLWELVSPNVAAGGTSHVRIDNAAEVFEYWERPCKEYPRGRLIVYANGVVLRNGDNPFHGTPAEIPISRMRDITRGIGFWGIASTDAAIPSQRNYNKARCDLIQNAHDHVSMKWMIPRGAAINQGALDRTSDEVLEYNLVSVGVGTPAKPERVPGGQANSLITVPMEVSDAELKEAFGISDISQGQAPKGVSAGVALDLLLKESDARLGSLNQELLSCLSRLGHQVLAILKRYVKDERKFLEIVGEGQSPAVMAFTGSDLNVRNVRVRMGTVVERRRMGRRQTAVELLQYGGPELFTAPEARRVLFQAVGLGDAVATSETVDIKRGKKIVAELREGEYPPILPWQNHAVILEVLTEWMNSLGFDEEDETVQALAVQQWQERLAASAPPPMMMGGAPPEMAAGPPMADPTGAPEPAPPQPGLPPPGDPNSTPGGEQMG